jgi:carboxyl-terminal processing protease
MKIRFASILPVFFFLIVFSSFAQDKSVENGLKLKDLLQYIDQEYVDTVNLDQLTESAIIKILHDLDPHSSYISREDVKEMNEPLIGNFEGIGITFNVLDDTIYVISPISGGPSEKVGIMAGDRIVLIEGENVAGTGITSKGVRDRLLGDKGTQVTVGIKRRGVNEILDFTITRDKIPIYSLDASYMINDSIGYIRINRFARTTLKEFFEAIYKLREQDMKHLVLDLSGNGGGYLEIAVHLADQFLGYDKLIVYTEGEHNERHPYQSTPFGQFKKGRLVVLIDEGSASASEIVTGAIQDWDRGVVIGRRSFGKGLVQKPFYLPDSSMIRLTIARYYTPTGRLIQKSYDKGFDEYRKDIINRYNNGELSDEDKISFPDSLKYYTLRNKRVVYGGGGIMPDYFIPYDTSYYTDYYRSLLSKGILNRFVLNYVDENRKNILKEYSDFESFEKKYEVDGRMLEKLINYAEKNEVEKNQEEYATSKEQIRHLIKAYIARDIWTTTEFYRIFNTRNESMQKALEILISPEVYEKKLKG